MKVKRFKATLHADEILAWPSPEAYKWSGEVVLATDYDALLALARRLRHQLVIEWEASGEKFYEETDVVIGDSAWLEE